MARQRRCVASDGCGAQDSLTVIDYPEICQLIASGALAAAQQALEVVLGLDPTDPAGNYYLAHLAARLGKSALARKYIERSGLAPGADHDLMPFTQHAAFAERFQREQAIMVPPMLLAALPKSGSTFLALALCVCAGVPCGRVAFGSFPAMVVIPRWLSVFLRGGGATHCHFSPSDENLAELVDQGVDRVFVHLRDPRQAMLSYVHMERRDRPALAAEPLQAAIERFLAERYGGLVDWIEGWLDAGQRSAGRLAIGVGSYEEMQGDKPAYIRRVLAFYGQSAGRQVAPEEAVRLIERQPGATNLRLGRRDEWREVLTAAQRQRATTRLPDRLRRMFGEAA